MPVTQSFKDRWMKWGQKNFPKKFASRQGPAPQVDQMQPMTPPPPQPVTPTPFQRGGMSMRMPQGGDQAFSPRFGAPPSGWGEGSIAPPRTMNPTIGGLRGDITPRGSWGRPAPIIEEEEDLSLSPLLNPRMSVGFRDPNGLAPQRPAPQVPMMRSWDKPLYY